MTIPNDKMAILIDLLQVDLEKRNINDEQRKFMEFLINASGDEITRTGITLDLSKHEDLHLVEMHSAYLYRKRVLSDNGMPRMLQLELHSRLLAEKMKVI